ncbi:MAG: Gfo/Idh/MocA family oxidoreductase [Chitinophagaceae bacterium]|nr:MAG: Gfo/Idh/MocA family oxidoreductase [Chitinophagaceae bacterium]
MTVDKSLGIAIVGLGEYATTQLIPALKETKDCHLAALVSGTRSKLDRYKKEYGIDDEHLYTYDNFDDIATDAAVDIVYIVLPNSMHAEYCIRAARAGKHVICEKPMAMNPDECREIMQVIDQTGVRFSMGYRLHFDPYNKEMMRLGQKQVYGPVRKITLLDSKDLGEKRTWRVDRALAGGGPMMNYGVYCIQAAIYLTGKLPTAVEAKYSPVTDHERFDEVEEGLKFKLYFEGDLTAECECSYTKVQNMMSVKAEKGWFQLEPAFEYEGIKGITMDDEMDFGSVNQQALQMDDFARCIKENKPTRVPAEMGLRDNVIIKAVYDAADKNAKVPIRLEEFKELSVS